jgi:muramoyltetrapeptide carboxypeptidase
MKLIKPQLLKKGDTIGIVSPSAGLAPFAIHRIDNAIAYLKKSGFNVLVGKYALENDGYVSASIEKRLYDLHSMFSNPKVKGIICSIGGNNANQLLPFINYKLIKKNPKIFIGYSDISVLHFALQSQSRLATYFGPALMTEFGEYPRPLEYTISAFKQMVMKTDNPAINIKQSKFWTDEAPDWFERKDLLGPRKQFKNTEYEWIKKGQAVGFAWGGTIPSINHLLGTKYWVDPKGSIFFLDIPEGKDIGSGLDLSAVDAYLTDLDNAGIFKDIKGLVVGRPYRYSIDDHKKFKEIILRLTSNSQFPIMYNANIGHANPIVTLRYGQKIELNSKENTFKIWQ